MSQATDYVLAYRPGAAFRAGLNTILDAIASSNAGGSAPPNPQPGMWWFDTSLARPAFNRRNAANSGWDVIDATAYGLGLSGVAAVTGIDAVTFSGFCLTTSADGGNQPVSDAYRVLHLPGISSAGPRRWPWPHRQGVRGSARKPRARGGAGRSC